MIGHWETLTYYPDVAELCYLWMAKIIRDKVIGRYYLWRKWCKSLIFAHMSLGVSKSISSTDRLLPRNVSISQLRAAECFTFEVNNYTCMAFHCTKPDCFQILSIRTKNSTQIIISLFTQYIMKPLINCMQLLTSSKKACVKITLGLPTSHTAA